MQESHAQVAYRPPQTQLVFWMRLILSLAAVGVILIDIYLFEVVWDHAHSSPSHIHVKTQKPITRNITTTKSLRVSQFSDGQSSVSKPSTSHSSIRFTDPPLFVGLSNEQQRAVSPLGAVQSSLPSDFDWQAYLDYNEDVEKFGRYKDVAVEHYMAFGYKEARPYKRIRSVLRYTACGGLMNQHYSHVAAMVIAASLGADIIIPHAVRRDSFSKYFSMDPAKSTITWSLVNFGSIWNAEYVESFLRGQGIDMYLAPSNATMPDLRFPQVAYQSYRISQFSELQHTVRGDLYLASQELPAVLEKMKKDIVSASSQASKRLSKYSRVFPPVLLDLPCTLFSLKFSDLQPAATVARHLKFSSKIEAIAEMVLQGVTRHGSVAFNGLHLRIEEDATDWQAIFGGNGQYWHLYLEQCKRAGFSPHMPIYVATGVVSYQGKSKMAELQEIFRPFASLLLYKEQFMQPEEIKALHPEQLALVDFLVLVKSRRFVGLSASTFSVYVREYRNMLNVSSRNTSFLVDSTVVGTEPLFRRSAMFP